MMVGVDLLPGLDEVSESLECGGIGHAPIARGKLDDFDEESVGRHVNEIRTHKRRGERRKGGGAKRV
jgi:hypothetical protein